MQKSKINIRLAIIAVFLALLTGCTMPWNTKKEAEVGITPYHPESLWNLRQGREYMAAGRYELAREHYLLGLAASDNAEMRNILTSELRAADMMIKTLR